MAERAKNRKPSHPGSVLKNLYLIPLKVSNTQLAETLNVSRKTISTIVNERASVTPDMALRLARAFGTSPELWLNLQKSYDLWQAARRNTGWQQVSPVYAAKSRAAI